MTYHFNLYDSPHYGILLNQIDDETYQSFLEGEDDETSDLNVVTLKLDPRRQYWVDIPEDYNYFDLNREAILDKTPVEVFTERPQSPSGLLFHLKYNPRDKQWGTTLL